MATSLATVSVHVRDEEIKQKLRLEAAKRGMTLSRYCELLLSKATNGYTNFDVSGVEVKPPFRKKKQ